MIVMEKMVFITMLVGLIGGIATFLNAIITNVFIVVIIIAVIIVVIIITSGWMNTMKQIFWPRVYPTRYIRVLCCIQFAYRWLHRK